MDFQEKVCYGKETVKAVALLINIERSWTRREKILQESITNSKERQKYPCKACQDTMS